MILLPGFADPVGEAHATFRAVLDAMAHPGRVASAGAGLQPPAPLCQAAAAVLLTLIDADTPLWLADAFSPARDWIAFHCGALLAADPARAAFALTTSLPDLTLLPGGSDESPETSATLIVQVAGFERGQRLVLSGPGLREPFAVTVDGLPTDFPALWSENASKYPRGIDLLLCAGAELVALPRSVAIVRG
jgi:alpha-D-ribose 1-methylphosphonate 5-triphosphate synthase subunit PhnH